MMITKFKSIMLISLVFSLNMELDSVVSTGSGLVETKYKFVPEL